MKRIVADPAKCLACRSCELACALAHVEKAGQEAGADDLVEALAEGARPRMYVEAAAGRVASGSFGKVTRRGLAVPLQCRHCDDAPCVRVCPTGALARLSEGAPVLADQDRCIGCGFCVQVCPFGIVRLSLAPGGRTAVVKCDLCIRRRGQGLEPACVAACPVGALSFEEVEEGSRRKRARAAAAVASGTEE